MGTVELAAVIAGPIVLCVIIVCVAFTISQQRRINRMRRIPYGSGVESNSLLMPSEQTLRELVDDWSNSGSGSGEQHFKYCTLAILMFARSH